MNREWDDDHWLMLKAEHDYYERQEAEYQARGAAVIARRALFDPTGRGETRDSSDVNSYWSHNG